MAGAGPQDSMSLSDHQLAEARSALRFDRGRGHGPQPQARVEPPVHPPEDRRNAPRLRERCNAEISEWFGDRAGAAFGVVVDDISTAGVRLLHDDRLTVGGRYLLEIPRPRRAPLAVLLTVVRCAEHDGGGLFDVHLAPDEVLSVTADHAGHDDPAAAPPPRRLSRLRAAAIILAFAASVAAVFFNLV